MERDKTQFCIIANVKNILKSWNMPFLPVRPTIVN